MMMIWVPTGHCMMIGQSKIDVKMFGTGRDIMGMHEQNGFCIGSRSQKTLNRAIEAAWSLHR